MYKRKLNQVTIFQDPAMFGGISLNPNNTWVKLANLIPWWAFEEKYAEQFPSETGQPAGSLRVALGSQLIKEKYHFSDEMIVEEIAMNPYLQYFLGFPHRVSAGSADTAVRPEHDDALPAETDAGAYAGSQRCDHRTKESRGCR